MSASPILNPLSERASFGARYAKSEMQNAARLRLADFDLSFAFQPIVDVVAETIHSYEALVRGTDGSSATSVLRHVTPGSRFRFEQTCNRRAMELAIALGMDSHLNLNFAVDALRLVNESIDATLHTASEIGFPSEKLVFELVESSVCGSSIVEIARAYHDRNLRTALDDFGAANSCLVRLVNFQPDYVKLDIALVRNVHADRLRRIVVAGMIGICRELGIKIVAEGVETYREYEWLRERGVRYFQGFLFARPKFEALPHVEFAPFR